MKREPKHWTAYKGKEFNDRSVNGKIITGVNNRCDATKECESMCSFTKQAYFCEDFGYICECLTTFYSSLHPKKNYKEVEEGIYAKKLLNSFKCYKLDHSDCLYKFDEKKNYDDDDD